MTRPMRRRRYRGDVFGRRSTELRLIGYAFAGSALVMLVTPLSGIANLLFLAVLLWCGLTVFRSLAAAGRRALAERRRARRLASTSAAEVARRAVAEERARLAADIEAVVRQSVTSMGEQARTAEDRWNDDPVPALIRVQDEGRRAATELRRMLGLLREAEVSVESRAPGVALASRPSRADVLLAAAAMALAVVERYPVGPDLPPVMHSWQSVAFTAMAAGTLVLRRCSATVGAALCGLLFISGAIVGHPPSPGLWILVTPCWLVWTVMARRNWQGAGAAAALIGGVALALGRYDPVNLPMCLVMLAVAGVGGATVGWTNGRRASAHEQVVRRTAELDAVADEAVHSERLAVARDLHDVVSHAVAVMMMQAGAADALRHTDPVRARAALRVVQQAAAETLVELDGLVAAIARGTLGAVAPAAGSVERDARDLAALVDRMGGTGLQIELEVDGRVDGVAGATVYRIAQEALTNAARHASGSRVTVRVCGNATGTTVEVVDDGPGSATEAPRGYGLVGIAERVERLGGQLTTEAGVGGAGFRICARLPGIGAAMT